MALLRPGRRLLLLAPLGALCACVHAPAPPSAGGALVLHHRAAAGAAPSAVSVVGDFNGWDPSADVMRRDPDAGFTAVLHLAPGPHVYAYAEQFPDGGEQVVTPEDAPAYLDDDLGGRNGLIRIAPVP